MSIMLLLIILVPTIEEVDEPCGCQFSRCSMKYQVSSIVKGIIQQHFVANYGCVFRLCSW